MMQTAFERQVTTAKRGDEKIVVYLAGLLGDQALAHEIVQHTLFLKRSGGDDEQLQRYRLAATIAVETVRAQARNATYEQAPRVTLQENALKRMPVPWHRAFQLYVYECASYAQIGTHEGITEGTAHTRVCRAKRWLWEVLPSLSCVRPASETRVFPFLYDYLQRLLENDDDQPGLIASAAIEAALRRRASRSPTPFDRVQRCYLQATELVVNTLHEQAEKESDQTHPLLSLRTGVLEGMPERLRRSLLFYIRGEGYAHIAKRESIQLNNAVSRVSQARIWLRVNLVPPDELATATATVEWAESEWQTQHEEIRETDRPDAVLTLNRPKDGLKGSYL